MSKTKIIYLRRRVIAALACVLAAVMMFWVVNHPAVVGASASTRQLPIYCVQKDYKVLSISFDAAWGNEDTEKILSVLEKQGVKVTFFATGGWVESYPEDVKAVLAAGHDLGNHSENHKNMSQLSTDEMKSELMKVHDKVKNLTGYEMFLFRPPYGDYSNEVIQTANSLGYYSIQWDVDSPVTHGIGFSVLCRINFTLHKQHTVFLIILQQCIMSHKVHSLNLCL